MIINQVNFYLMVFTPCFALVAGILIGITAADQKYIDEDETTANQFLKLLLELKYANQGAEL